MEDSQLHIRDVINPLPEKATSDDKKWQPVLDFDTDSCYNTAAIDPSGNVNKGMDHNYSGPSEGCRDKPRLENANVYSRARCNNGWCAYMYDYYFEKDVAVPNVIDAGGHVHEWEHIVVFVQNGHAKVVAAGGHGDFDTKKADEIRWEGNHPKIVYHKSGGSTHAFRFAAAKDDKVENETGKWVQSALVSWNGFPSTKLRDTLMSYVFDNTKSGGKPKIGIKDENFKDNLNWAKNDLVPGFNSGSDDGSPGNP
ncbi:uncharacterized protein JN550_011271 [Neoarthrinium moseri]|uniref:uncharacterized protein n=1 Tax=Neoarthrinium moseri TaxID=1658444 RepID=UPI001FDE18D9|nr:uncharacterized protein JN550_011271 [Neoarthrinium moseri]KAI1860809.1 hypothetical protein JN550_011271 [Neoarthrinium moseri]